MPNRNSARRADLTMKLFSRSRAHAGIETDPDAALLRMVQETQAVIHFRPDGTILTANENFLAALGYTLDEVLGKNHAIFVDEDYRQTAAYRDFWTDLAGGKAFTSQFARITKSGETIWIQATYAPVRNAEGVVERVVKVASDVTARRVAISTITEGLEELKTGNLAHRIPSCDVEDIQVMVEAFNAAATQLATLVSNVKTVSGAIEASGSEIRGSAENLSNRTETQAATLEQTAAAVEELTANAASAAENAKRADQTAENTRSAAKDGGRVVEDVIQAMGRIEKSSDQISQIISVIDDIAFQTNLLSLNAGVEAARAGDAGRGFAVVASEVRALAQRSAESAREIKALITESGEHVSTGADLVQRASQELSTIFDGVGMITDSVRQISSGLHEQSTTLSEINSAFADLDRVTQSNAAMALQTVDLVKALTQNSQTLSRDVSTFVTDGVTTGGQWQISASRRTAIAQ
ncbi:PAS domain S-box protein [Ponticoccus gilvus]|nr:PAS domain S-box protein [Enemella evansiae]